MYPADVYTKGTKYDAIGWKLSMFLKSSFNFYATKFFFYQKFVIAPKLLTLKKWDLKK